MNAPVVSRNVAQNVRLLAWFNFFSDFRFYAPVAILYFSQVSGSYAVGMNIFSITMLASSLFEVPTGVLSDMIGRKRTVVAGAMMSVAAVIGYAIGGTYPILVIGAVFEGCSRAFFSGNNDALLHDTLTESGIQDDFQAHLGRTSSMFQVALAASAIIGSVIAAVSYPAVMWLSVVPQVAALVVSLRFVEPGIQSNVDTNIYAHLRTAFDNVIRNRRLRYLTASSVLSFAAGEAAFQFRSTFIQAIWATWAVGIARTISNITAALSFYFSGPAIQRFGERRIITIGKVYSHGIALTALLIPTVLSPALMATTSIFFGVIMVATGGLMQREFTQEQRATMGSLTSFVGSLGFAVFSFVMGLFADRFGVIPALFVAELISLASLLLFHQAFRATSPLQNASINLTNG